jgi:hypothetical protein
MKTRTTIVLVAAAFALALASTSIITPMAVKAAVATLIRDVDNPARQPFATSCSTDPGFGTEVFCKIPVPAGVEVVIQSVSVVATSDKTNSPVVVSFLTSVGLNELNEIYPLFPVSLTPNELFNRYVDARNLTFSADPGFIVCVASTNQANPSRGLGASFFVAGYFVTLP